METNNEELEEADDEQTSDLEPPASLHKRLIKLGALLGYTENEEGICQGFSINWLEAEILLDHENKNTFNNRIKIINNYEDDLDDLIEEINNVLENKKKNPKPSSNDIEQFVFGLLAFYGKIEAFLKPEKFSELFDVPNPLRQDDIKIISAIASSDEIQKRGGLETLYSEPLIPDLKELVSYLDELKATLENIDPPLSEPLGLLFCNYHAIAMSYHPGKGFTLMDINQHPPIRLEDHETIARKLIEGFQNIEGVQENLENPYMAMNVSLISTGNNKNKAVLQETLKTFKDQHVITEEIAQRSGLTDLVWIAARYGHDAHVKTLAQKGADINKANSKGFTPTCAAAYYGQAEAIIALAEEGANLDLGDLEGRTPTYIAAFFGRAEALIALAESGANLDLNDLDGITPAYIAAEKGNIQALNVLIKYKADLNKADNEGLTPVMIAIKQGNMKVLEALYEAKADFTSDKLMKIAMKQENSSVIEFLKEVKSKISTESRNGNFSRFKSQYEDLVERHDEKTAGPRLSR